MRDNDGEGRGLVPFVILCGQGDIDVCGDECYFAKVFRKNRNVIKPIADKDRLIPSAGGQFERPDNRIKAPVCPLRLLPQE
ncbi:hypothetical protein D3C75_1157540 [compost metagenome]